MLATKESVGKKGVVKEFIKAHWQKMTDEGMASRLSVNKSVVEYQRRRLGLEKQRGRKEGLVGVKAQIDCKWLEKALNEDGLTQADVARQLHVTRGEICRVCKDWGTKVQKTALWYANKYGMPELTDKDWFEKELRAARSIEALSRKLGFYPGFVREQAKRIGVDPSVLTYQGERVQLTCTHCRKKIIRLKSDLRPNQTTFFCDKVCHGKWLGTQFGSVFHWSEKDIEFLKANFKKMTDRELAEALGASKYSVKYQRNKLGLKKTR